MILLRGLPGSGKSTIAGLLSEGKKYPVFSVDDYFTDDAGNYEFRFSENHLAYRRCEENVTHAASSGIEKIFVDNTFTLDWEFEKYFNIAALFGYAIFVMTVEKYHTGENIHGITKDQLLKMAEKFKVKLF